MVTLDIVAMPVTDQLFIFCREMTALNPLANLLRTSKDNIA